MAFTEKLPEWQAEGIEPPDSKKQTGWEVEDKPPAGWLNWVWNRTFKVLEELRNKVADKEYVDEAVAGVKVDVPDASLTVKGKVQLSNAIDRDREDIAATEKAVHDATKYADTQITFNKAQIEQETRQNMQGVERELANLNLQLEASKRVPNGVTFGSNFADSFGMTIDTTKLTVKMPLAVGQTDIPIDSIGGLRTGMEVTVYDDVNIERTTATTAETVDTVTNYVATDTTVVNSAYDTSGNGGRKLVRLSNGWLVAGVRNGNTDIKFYISKDDGKSFSLLATYTNTGTGQIDWSLAPKGIDIYFILGYAVGTEYRVLSGRVNGLTGTLSSHGMFEGSLTALGNCSLAINDAGTELHAAWSSKNATYPNSFNIRYAKGVINADGTVTWGSAEQVTTDNQTNVNNTTPSIVTNGAGVPVILSRNDHTYNAWQGIDASVKNGSWSSVHVYATPGSTNYSQGDPSTIFVPKSINGLTNGRIWVAWHGLDNVDTTYQNIRVSYSDDGGATWSTPTKITSGNLYAQFGASITADRNNNVYAVWYGNTSAYPSYGIIRYSKFDGSAWSAPTDVTTVQSNYPSAINDLTLDTTTPLFIYKNTGAAKIGFYGTWKATVSVATLKLAPLTKAYKAGANIARTSAVIDTVNKCLKFGGWTTQVLKTVNDSTVVSGNMNIPGPGGRKIARLSDGTLVAVAWDSTTIYTYSSKDDGQTWALENTFGTSSISDVAIVGIGNDYGILRSTAGSTISFSRYRIGGGSIASATLDNGLTASGGCSLTINDAGTELHAAWAHKNETYGDSFNIRYAKGIINAGGTVTWGSVQQVTNANNSVTQYTAPALVLNNSGYPIILVSYKSSASTYNISRLLWDGTGWGYKSVYDGGGYIQYSPSAIFVPKSINGLTNGRIWVAWHGSDSVDTSKPNIRVSYSDDGGVTWSTMRKLTSGDTEVCYYASITANRNGDTYILFSGTSAASHAIQQIGKIKYTSGGAWGVPEYVTSNTVNILGYPSALYDPNFDFSSPLFIFMGNKGTQYLGFYGTWSTETITPILENDVRFTVKDTDEAVAWIQRDPSLTVTAALNGQTMDKTTAGNEDQFVKALTASGPAEIRLTMKRSSTSDDAKINKILGGVG